MANSAESHEDTGRIALPHLLPLTLLLVIGALYLGPRFRSGWIPHDEGMLAHTAERVLAGEVPHRDFDEMYSGGLTYLHAGAMKLLGVRLSSMRWLLLLVSLVCLSCWYLTAAHFLSRWGAMLVSLICFAWSLPNYFAALPSWYNVMLASVVLLGLLRYGRQRRSRWLLLAGTCCGLSLVIKIVGLYTLAATLLSLLAIHLPEFDQAESPQSRIAWPERACILAPSLLLCLLVLLLIRQHLSLSSMLLFVLPSFLLAVVLVQLQAHRPGWGAGQLVKQLAPPLLLTLTAAALPVLLWLGYYGSMEALGDLFHGVFVLPQVRLDKASSPLPPVRFVLASLPLLFLMLASLPVAGHWLRRNPLWMALSPLPLLTLALLAPAATSFSAALYQPIFLSLYYLPAGLLLAAVGWSRECDSSAQHGGRELYILAAPLATMALIQYPYASGVYFCYYAPFLILALSWFAGRQSPAWQVGWLAGGLVYLGFAVLAMNFTSPRALGVVKLSTQNSVTISTRGDLRVEPQSRDVYAALVELIERQSPVGAAIYAAPDCPEVYFLSNRRNPTRTLYDIFDTAPDRVPRLLQMLEDYRVQLVVLAETAEFSGPLPADLLQELRRRYPFSALVGRPRSLFDHAGSANRVFEVRWR